MPWRDLSHRKTCRRYDQPGDAHYLTFSCFRRQPFLSGRVAPVWLIDSINAARAKCPFDLWAFVFMPQHVHL
jgi:putative transposase